MTVDLTGDELLLIHQAVKEYYFDLLSDQLNYDVDDFYKAQNVGVSNSQLYKQAGNSIVVNVLQRIFRQFNFEKVA